jgi:hypothetical protein
MHNTSALIKNSSFSTVQGA